MSTRYWFENCDGDTRARIEGYRGGLSEDTMLSMEFVRYAGSGHVCGYIGSEQRTKKRDQIVERLLREDGLGDNGVAVWLSSTAARHMMDNVEKKTSKEAFELIARENITGQAFKAVAIWSHPDHQGNMASTMRLSQMFLEQFSAQNPG